MDREIDISRWTNGWMDGLADEQTDRWVLIDWWTDGHKRTDRKTWID